MTGKADITSLIYEFNSESPLFARVAKKYIDEGEFDKAEEILKKGIKFFPEYPTGYFIYALLHANRGDHDLASEAAETGGRFLNNDNTVKFYSGIDEYGELQDDEESGEDNPERENVLNESDLRNIIDEYGDSLLNDQDGEKPAPMQTDSNKIVSETLANIHIMQGHFKEATEIYKLLIKKNPERTAYFEDKIREVEEKAKGGN